MAALYRAFMAHQVAADFDPHSLQVVEKSTSVMREIQESAIDINRKAVEEYFAKHDIIAVNMDGLKYMVEQKFAAKPSALKHVLADLGWVSKDAKWGGKDYKRVLWLKPGFTLVGGVISGPNTWELDTDFVDSSKGDLGRNFYVKTQGKFTDPQFDTSPFRVEDLVF